MKFLFIFLFSISVQARLFNHFPENVRQSFAWGITHNLALKRDDLLKMIAIAFPLVKNPEALSDQRLRELLTRPIEISYVEIPVRQLKALGIYNYSHSNNLSADESPLEFNKNGETWARIFIHPLRQDREFLKILGSPAVQKGKFLAQLTESRSVVIMNRESGNYWGLKLSLPKAYGAFNDKTFTAEGAGQQFILSEHLLEQKKKGIYKNTQYLHEKEALGITIGEWSEGQTVRDLSILRSGGFLLAYDAIVSQGLAAFWPRILEGVELFKEEMRWLAQKPAEAAAHLFSHSGVSVHSNHSQNNLVYLSPDREWVEYYRRDFDWNYIKKKAPESALSKTQPAVEEGYIDYSLGNTFDEGTAHYSRHRIGQFAFQFAAAFFSELGRIEHWPRRVNRSKILWMLHSRLSRPDHYSFDTQVLLDQGKYLLGHATSIENRHDTFLEKYPELKDFLKDPTSFLSHLITDFPPRGGDTQSDISEYLLERHPKELQQAWNKLISDHMSSSRRSSSAIQLALDDPHQHKNLFFRIGDFFQPAHFFFVQDLLNTVDIKLLEKEIAWMFGRMERSYSHNIVNLQFEELSREHQRLLMLIAYKIGNPKLHSATKKFAPYLDQIRTCEQVFNPIVRMKFPF